MRVDSNPNLSINPTTTSRPAEVTSTVTRANEPNAVADSSFTQTPDLARLLAAVKEAPELREDVIADVKERLLKGELNDHQAAIDTAQVILDSNAVR